MQGKGEKREEMKTMKVKGRNGEIMRHKESSTSLAKRTFLKHSLP
jgi:hypothetical protein